MKTCPYCAEEIQETAIKCRWCQSDLSASGVETGSSERHPLAGPGAGEFSIMLGDERRNWDQADLRQIPAPAPALAPIVVTTRPDVRGTRVGSGMAVAALVLGIISFLIPIICGVLAVIFGAIGIGNSNNRGAPGKGMAIAGFVLGIVTVVAQVALLAQSS